MVKFPFTSEIDLSTYDIIMSEAPTFKKKNSLVYKGVLSNMTYQKGEGFLSTAGKQITVDGSSITAGSTVFNANADAYITESGEFDTSDDILCARKIADDMLIIHKIDDNNISIENKEGTTQLRYDNAVTVNGTITQSGKFIVAEYLPSGANIYIYDSSMELIATKSTVLDIGSMEITSYEPNSSMVYLGFDSEDLRKRYVYRYLYSVDVLTVLVHGMACISDSGLITGEPFFYTATKSGSREHDSYHSADYQSYGLTDLVSVYYDANPEFHNFHQLENGVMRYERFDTSYSSPKYTTYSYNGDAAKYETIESTLGKSWIDEVKELGKNENGDQTNKGNIPDNTGIMSFSPGAYSADGSDGTTIAIHLYVCAIQIKPNGLFDITALPAMRRGNVSVYSEDGRGQHNDQENAWLHSQERDTEISFFDYDQPIGLLNHDIQDYDQVYPHMRFFQNIAANRGKYWDYGKGWVRFTYDTIHFLRYTNYGTAVYEEPLKVITITKDGIHSDEIDWQFSNSQSDYYVASTTDVMGTQKFTKGSDTKELQDFSSTSFVMSSDADGDLRSTDFQGNPKVNYTVRNHPVLDEQTNADTNSWTYSHSMSGTNVLVNVPFSAAISDRISTQVYNLIGISLSYDKTLLFTPHDMMNSYSLNGDYVTSWSKGKISWAKIENTGSIYITKMTDYIFKTNIIGQKNVLVEDRNGNFTFQRAFIPYVMNSTITPYVHAYLSLPVDSTESSYTGEYFFAAGYNPNLSPDRVATSFLFPPVEISTYVKSDEAALFEKQVINNPDGGIIRADILPWFYMNELVEEYWTQTMVTAGIGYKDTAFVNGQLAMESTLEQDFRNQQWTTTADTQLYPIGILSKTLGENYITSTVDVGDNYVSRFYNNNNKTFLSYLAQKVIYYGSEIFTIQSGNYYFDGQGIYYLGSYTDYSQNVFVAYGVGMRFLANSSSEAYFYSDWDRNIYIFTPSNTLQRSVSLADMGDIVDSLYSPSEQSLYVLFDDGKMFVKTQADSCLIDGIQGSQLQSTTKGCQVIGDDGYEIYNPYLWNDILPLEVETEWVGDQDLVYKHKYVDLVLYSDVPGNYSVTVGFKTIDGQQIYTDEQTIEISRDDWNNKLLRRRLVPQLPVGNAMKVTIRSNEIKLFAMSINIEQVSEQTSAPRDGRY